LVIKLNYKVILGILFFIFMITTLFASLNNFSNASYKTGGDEIIIDTLSVRLPIIMYHQIKNHDTGKDVITEYELENDLKFLQENSYNTINISQLLDYVENNAPLPENPIILSFDDGYLNNYVNVFPLLKKYNMKIVLSIIGKSTDDFSDIPDANMDYSHITWTQLNEMINSGLVELQNHTYNMHINCKGRFGCTQKWGESDEEYEKFIMDDLGKLQDRIKEMTGKLPTAFAYPYGKLSGCTDEILKKMGFKATLSCRYGINVITKNPETLYGLKRICRAHGKNLNNLIKEAMKTLK